MKVWIFLMKWVFPYLGIVLIIRMIIEFIAVVLMGLPQELFL